MEIRLRHNPSFAVARLYLQPNEPVKVEGGAMVAHSPGVQLSASTDGGILKGLKRAALGGESFFVTTYTAPAQGGWVDVAGVLPGGFATAQYPVAVLLGSRVSRRSTSTSVRSARSLRIWSSGKPSSCHLRMSFRRVR